MIKIVDYIESAESSEFRNKLMDTISSLSSELYSYLMSVSRINIMEQEDTPVKDALGFYTLNNKEITILYDTLRDDDFGIYVFLHELGHHKDAEDKTISYSNNLSDRHKDEVTADTFAKEFLEKLGITHFISEVIARIKYFTRKSRYGNTSTYSWRNTTYTHITTNSYSYNGSTWTSTGNYTTKGISPSTNNTTWSAGFAC